MPKRTETKLAALIAQRPIPVGDIVTEIARMSLGVGDSDFLELLDLAKLDDVYDEQLAIPAMAAMPGWGKQGIDQLLQFAFDEQYKISTCGWAINILLEISQGNVVRATHTNFLHANWDTAAKYTIDDELVKYTLIKLRENLLSAFDDDYKRSRLLFNLGTLSMTTDWEDKQRFSKLDHFLSLIVDNQLILNSSLIRKFELLLDTTPENEEELQRFLTEHPILLDPLVGTLHTKQALGSDFITDYVIQRINDQYILVEIEDSKDELFTQSGNFSSALTTALAQVRDFQAWISDNLSYAQKKLPRIKHPEGLVVIGRSVNLSELERKQLAEENFGRRGHVRIVTYDDLLFTAKTIHRNLIERPMVSKTRDKKGI